MSENPDDCERCEGTGLIQQPCKMGFVEYPCPECLGYGTLSKKAEAVLTGQARVQKQLKRDQYQIRVRYFGNT
jgi:DnaJ-class molecular chaperone